MCGGVYVHTHTQIMYFVHLCEIYVKEASLVS